ncbi:MULTISPECIES: STM4014 family protein [unclassified Leptolyngbya]|uniref:STM4014 family protein n=1 Tax=unclassified Leptolyngbya TaxID=2650499 RepID=UPI001687D158|nr:MULTISPECIES: STM4014 family protein [unclassified Leptolyngbya]MBD1914061.1 STM4014 family protein [Leptolyngbya sp. FACHB-8]MBD2152981.1 STM4014 family protein [Leptolyngbya sp. FACHB-16]
MLNFVLIANPETRRVELFQQALARFDLPAAELIPYEELLEGRCSLSQWDAPIWYRFDAPERSFAVDRALIAAGTEVQDTGQHQRIGAIEAYRLPPDKGRILYPRQWYLGWRRRLQEWAGQMRGTALNHPEDIITMFDKVQCQRILAHHQIPIPHSLIGHAPILSYDDLRDRMDQQNCQRVFVKLAHGSSASGVVAYERRSHAERVTTTVERVIEQGELRFYNSRKIRQYSDSHEIADIMNFLLKESAQVEAWMPKARLEGREFDARVVVIGGKARQVVLRVGNSPMTNLHLGNDRRDVSALPRLLTPDIWQTMLQTCERAAACFPHSFYCGIDLLVAPNLHDHYILELNAFGDLLQGITWQGQDTYTTEITTLLEQQKILIQI